MTWGAVCESLSGSATAELNDVIETPALDRIGQGGVVFNNALVSVPGCKLCRASVSTILEAAGIEPDYRRSGYVHLIHTPTGQDLTGDLPADHAHQHTLFFAWTKSGCRGLSPA